MTSENQPKIAILDDYQGVALQYADWSIIRATRFIHSS
jgi:hypothetical protein